MRIAAVLLLAALILSAAAALRPAEYDEAYSIFLTAGDARPHWPSGVFSPAAVRPLYAGAASPGRISHDLRAGDVHPPLYFWLLEYWRRGFGASWLAARMLSVVVSVATLGVLAWLAAMAGVPVVPALLICLLSYGFAYTGTVARGFALAQLLNLLGVAASFYGARKCSLVAAFAGGVLLGAAGFTNYLACFTGAATLLWLLLSRQWRCLGAALAGFVLFLPAALYFFLAQKSSRIGQFTSFSWPHALGLLARDAGAAWFGGLPVYAGRYGGLVALLLALLLCACLVFVVRRWRPPCLLFALAALATPVGLLLLGLVFGNTPIEIRYLAFSLPFTALLFAAALPRGLLFLLLGIDACAIAGLLWAPSTMQPQALAARQIAAHAGPGALILLPYGNDGVGIPGPFIQAAPDDFRIELMQSAALPNLSDEDEVFLANINADAASRAVTAAIVGVLQNDSCWQQQYARPLWLAFGNRCKSSQHPR